MQKQYLLKEKITKERQKHKTGLEKLKHPWYKETDGSIFHVSKSVIIRNTER